MRDLMDEPVEVVAAERSRVALERWGAKVLELQTPGHHWGGDDESRRWMTTTYALALLKDLGAELVAKEVRTALDRVREHIT
jgi:hypothetical protein